MKTEIFDYGMNGEGVGKIDGKIVLLPNSLPFEVVNFEIEQDNSNFCVGNVLEIENMSEKRTTPPCPYYLECGGCDLQHIKYDEQLNFKRLLVKKTLKKVANIDVEVQSTVESFFQFGYRNKLSLNIKNSKCGFFKAGSKQLVEINKCLLANKTITEISQFVVNELKDYAFNVKNLVVRNINNQTLIGIVTTKLLNFDALCEKVLNKFKNVGIYQVVNTRKDSVVLDGKTIHVGGIKEIQIENFGLNYSVDLLGFHQTNEDIQNKIYSTVVNMIDEQACVLNGFSGQGLLSAIIAKKAKQVYGIEINLNSHKSAEKLKKDNKVKNLTNICGDFYKQFDKIKEKVNTIVLDPAKKGCGKQAMCAIMGVENIIYISCNPIALAKDLREILSDYEIETVIPFDMFPNTKNVETLVKLRIKK